MERPIRISLNVAILAVALFLLIPRIASAQGEWQPISPEDLALKDNPKSPGAHAMILYRESVVDSKFLRTDGVSVSEYVRVKIFTKEGTKEGDVEIPFYKFADESVGGSFSIVDVRGRTIRPDGSIAKFDGKIFEKTIVKVSGEKISAKTFTLPDVQPGCIIEYRYRKQYTAYWLPAQEWIVSSNLFMREAHFTMKPYRGPGSEDFRLYYRFIGVKEGEVPQEQPNGDYKMEVRDEPGIEDESLMPPERILQSRVEFFYRDSGEPMNEAPERYWDRIGKKFDGELERFVGKKNALNDEVSKVVSSSDSPEAKLRKIYTRVQQIRNLSTEDYKTKQEENQENLKSNSNVEDVLKHGYANGREINYLFVGLARAAGFDATEVYVTPRSKDVFQPNMKDSSQLTADVVWVKAGAQEYYLDPAARYYPFGLLPWYETASPGIRVSKQGSAMITTPPPASSDAILARHADLEVDADGSVSGKLQIDFGGQRGALLREENRKEDETGRKKTLEEEIHGWLPAGSTFEITKMENWDNNTVPIHVEGTVKAPGLATSAGKRMLVPVTIFQSQEAKGFQPEKRTNAIYFHYHFEELDDVKIKVPAGYKVESVPPAVAPTHAVITYEFAAAQQGDSVEVKRHLINHAVMLDVKYYSAVRTFFNAMKSNDDSQIVLQKSDSPKGN